MLTVIIDIFHFWVLIWGIEYGVCQKTLTFIMSNSVFSTISIMMKYSKGVDITILQILYFMLFRSLGIYLSSGRACIVKSIQDFCKVERQYSTF